MSRSNLYGLLAIVYRDAPTAEVVARLRSSPMAEALRDLGYDMAQGLAGELEAVTRRLCEEYTRIFVGPGHHVSPYASVHHDGEGQLWGDSTVRVKRFIEATGLSFEGNWDSMPDHIAIELELMQRLSAHQAQLWGRSTSGPAPGSQNMEEQLRRCLEAQQEFLRAHLCVWVPRFCDRMLAMPMGPVYRGIAELTRSIVLSDLELVVEALSRLGTRPVVQPEQVDEA